MTDEKDPPIEEPGFLGGVRVVDIGDIRVARGLSRRAHSSCPHARLMYDQNERRVWCKDCERDVEAFDAFTGIVEQYSRAYDSLAERSKEVAEAEKFQVRSIAAKKLDEAWRSRNMVPACPHCGSGLFPEDIKKNGFSMLGRDYAAGLAKRKQEAPVASPSELRRVLERIADGANDARELAIAVLRRKL